MIRDTKIPRGQSALLLGHLALSGTKFCTCEQLADAFWPGDPPANARHRLRQALVKLHDLCIPNSETTNSDKILHPAAIHLKRSSVHRTAAAQGKHLASSIVNVLAFAQEAMGE